MSSVEEDVERHRREAELLARRVAASEEHIDEDVHHSPSGKNEVDCDLGFRTGVRVRVVQPRKNDEEQPPEDNRHALADPPAVGVEPLVQRTGPDVPSARRLAGGFGVGAHLESGPAAAGSQKGGYHSNPRSSSPVNVQFRGHRFIQADQGISASPWNVVWVMELTERKISGTSRYPSHMPAKTRQRSTPQPARSGLARFVRSQRSHCLVEFAMVSPIFLLIVFSAIDISRLLYTYTAISSAARDGARTASLTGSLFSDCQIIQEIDLVGQGFPVRLDPSSIAGNSDPNNPFGALQPALPAQIPPNAGYGYIWPAVATADPPDGNCSSSQQ